MYRPALAFSLIVSGIAFGDSRLALSVEDVEPSTYARFVPERSDDFAWENDMIAFRAYGPALRDGAENAGIDCWLKRVPYPIINKWYDQAGTKGKSYHQDHGEGLDNYHVGSSAGCGGTSIWLDGKRGLLETYTKWNVLESSRERSVFVLEFQNEIEGHVYREEKKITIELGKRLFRADSTFWKDGELAIGLPIAIGITTHDGAATTYSDMDTGWVACWEELDGFGLGTGVVVDPGSIRSVEVIEPVAKDMGHNAVIVNTDAEGRIVYFAGYGWERAGVIATVDDWQAYLNEFSELTK